MQNEEKLGCFFHVMCLMFDKFWSLMLTSIPHNKKAKLEMLHAACVTTILCFFLNLRNVNYS